MQFNQSKYLTSPISIKLHDLLRQINDNDEYVYGLMEFCWIDEQRQKLVEVIENGVTNKNELCLWASSIYSNTDINELKAKYL